MSVDSERKIVKSPDYLTAYADGVMVRLGDEVSRLIFYQDDVEFDKEGELEKSRKSTLRFEVRIPQETLKQLAHFVYALTKAQDQAYDAMEGIKNEELNEKYDDLDSTFQSILYDTNMTEPNDKSIKDLEDEYADLLGRAQREKKHEPE